MAVDCKLHLGTNLFSLEPIAFLTFYYCREIRDKYVEGGIHMTNSAFFPLAALKEITATEYTRNISSFFTTIFESLDEIDYQQHMISTLDSKPFWKETTDPLEKAGDVSHYVPWFLTCNKHRFPYWFSQIDPRNRILFEAMRSEKAGTSRSSAEEVWRR